MSLLSIEWLKLKRYRTFWVMSCLFLALFPFWNWAFKDILDLKHSGGGHGGGPAAALFTNYYSFPEIWGMTGHWASWFVLFLAMVLIIVTTNEFSFRTSRQNIIDGYTRLQTFHAKGALILVMSLVTAIYYFVVTLVFGLITTGYISAIQEGLTYTGYMFLYTLNYLGFAFVLSLLLRRGGLTLGLFMIYSIFLELIITGLLNRFVYAHVGNFLPLQSSDSLLPFPLIERMVGNDMPAYAYLISSGVWCVIYYIIGRRVSLKRDL